MNLPAIDKTWSLFLDRDGVINVEKYNDYIHNWSQFKFYDGVLEAMKIFEQLFGKILVVTNQRGVEKGVHKLEDLENIHRNMQQQFLENAGRVDQVYYATSLDDAHPDRKPNPGMGWKARQDYPEIDFDKSIMVGNTLSDMHFGRNVGVACNVLIFTREEVNTHDEAIDFVYADLVSFARELALR